MLFNDYMAVGFSTLLRLKIESGPPEMGLKDERSNQPRALRCPAKGMEYTVPQG